MKNLKSFALGVVATALVATCGVSALAASGAINISINPNVQIKVNGAVFQPKNEKGKDVMVFTYDGTTYAPLRALAEAYDLEVGWDQNDRMAVVGEKGTIDSYIGQDINPAEWEDDYEVVSALPVYVDGKEITNKGRNIPIALMVYGGSYFSNDFVINDLMCTQDDIEFAIDEYNANSSVKMELTIERYGSKYTSARALGFIDSISMEYDPVDGRANITIKQNRQ